jgi:hypothetical protein
VNSQDVNASNVYHQRASECLKLAEGSSDMNERMRFRELALCWLRLSDYAEFAQELGPADSRLRTA